MVDAADVPAAESCRSGFAKGCRRSIPSHRLGSGKDLCDVQPSCSPGNHAGGRRGCGASMVPGRSASPCPGDWSAFETERFPPTDPSCGATPEASRIPLDDPERRWDEAQLEALVDEPGGNDSVSSSAFADRHFAALARADIFALSSRWEGLLTVSIEAMACGTPVLRLTAQVIPERFLRGKWGRLVPLGDTEALAAGIAAQSDSAPKPQLLSG